METLWSPWRSKYIGTFKDEAKKSEESCFMCDAVRSEGKDKELLIQKRYKHCFVIMNKFPYNNGHLLVAPNRHVGDILELNSEELNEIHHAIRDCIKAIKSAYNPHGFNIGVNMGRVSGAGLPGHIHYHVLPRWNGDTSFVSTLSDIKVVSIGLEESYQDIKKFFNE